MNGYQSSTLLLAGSVAAVSLWRGQHIQNVWSVLATNQGAAGTTLKEEAQPIGVDILGVAIITFIAGLSDDAGKMMIALSVGLWLLYLMSSKQSTSQPLGAAGNAAINAAKAFLQQKG